MTLHAYLEADQINESAVKYVKYKNKNTVPVYEKDEYFNEEKSKFVNKWDVIDNGLMESVEPDDLMCWWPEGDSMVLLTPEEANRKWEEFLGKPLEKLIEGLGTWRN